MRIVGGIYRGRKLSTPTDNTVRPTADRVREAIFNILAHNVPPLPGGATVLDLFCGTGAFGLEALSRGARHVTFVDKAS
ncbi:MAG: RsmD family RNA methyltransferase, partial [Gammaproteobacteria bacterium]